MLSEKTKQKMEEWEKNKKFTIYSNPMLYGPFSGQKEKIEPVLIRFLPKFWAQSDFNKKKNTIIDFIEIINNFYYFKGMPIQYSFEKVNVIKNHILDFSDDHIFLLSRVNGNMIIINEDLLKEKNEYLDEYILPENYMKEMFSCAVLEKLIYECENLLQELLINMVKNFEEIPLEYTQLAFTLFIDNIIEEFKKSNITYIGTTMCTYNLNTKYSPSIIRLHTLNNTFIRNISEYIFNKTNDLGYDKNFFAYLKNIKVQCDKNNNDVYYSGGNVVTDILNEKIKILLGYMTLSEKEEINSNNKLAQTPYNDIWLGTRNFVKSLVKEESKVYAEKKELIKNKKNNRTSANNNTVENSDENNNITENDNEDNSDNNITKNEKLEEDYILKTINNGSLQNEKSYNENVSDVNEKVISNLTNINDLINKEKTINNYNNPILDDNKESSKKNDYHNSNNKTGVNDSNSKVINNNTIDIDRKFNYLNQTEGAGKYSLRKIHKNYKSTKE